VGLFIAGCRGGAPTSRGRRLRAGKMSAAISGVTGSSDHYPVLRRHGQNYFIVFFDILLFYSCSKFLITIMTIL